MTHKQQAERLMNELIPFAKHMLSEYGEFFPFGGYLTTTGDVVHVGAEIPGDDHPRAFELVAVLKSRLYDMIDEQGICVAAVVTNVSVFVSEKGRKYDAIDISVDHVDGYTADVFYPYVIENRHVLYLDSFAQKGAGDILRRIN